MMHWNILDEKRIAILPLLHNIIADGFYLAGGTALALHIGHRDSIDFDFFTVSEIDTVSLFRTIETVFTGHIIQKVQEEKNTLGIIIDETIKISFMTYTYPLIEPTTPTEHFSLASILDIGCMKLSAITSRATNKDYIDLYFILQKCPLQTLLDACEKKFPTIDVGLILKSLVYFEDIINEPILYKENNHVDFTTIQESLKQHVSALHNL
jgi:hypothetical protein